MIREEVKITVHCDECGEELYDDHANNEWLESVDLKPILESQGWKEVPDYEIKDHPGHICDNCIQDGF